MHLSKFLKAALARFVILFVILLPLHVIAQGAPAGNSYGFNYQYEFDRNIATGILDTLAGETDSVTILAATALGQPYEWLLVRGACTGVDSVKVRLRMDCYDYAGTSVIYSVNFDSLAAQAAESYALPVGKSAFGGKYAIKGLTYTNNGSTTILNKWSLWKRWSKLK